MSGGGDAERVAAIVDALADLSPSAGPTAAALSISTESFRWLPAEAVSLLNPARQELDLGFTVVSQRIEPFRQGTFVFPGSELERDHAERLAGIDQVRPQQRSLRVGWLFVAGRSTDAEGKTTTVFHPLVTVPVRVGFVVGAAPRLVPAGDTEITDLIADRELRHRLEGEIATGGGALLGASSPAIPARLLERLPRLNAFAMSAARAAGLDATRLVPAEGPLDKLTSGELKVVAGVGVYALRTLSDTTRAGSLKAWTTDDLRNPTALEALYDTAPEAARAIDAVEAVESPYPLTPKQREAVVRSRHEPVTLVSGAPGTGKSHTVVAIASDALARGRRVLIATKTDATVDALVDLLERSPAPTPVVFGSHDRRDELVDRLSDGQLQPVTVVALAEAERAVARAREARAAEWAAIAERLAVELALEGGPGADPARTTAPALFLPDTDLDAVADRLRGARATGGGWWARRRARRAAAEIAADLGGRASSIEELDAALEGARIHRRSLSSMSEGGLTLAGRWERLSRHDDDLRAATGAWLAAGCRSAQRFDRNALSAISALATALRSGRAARREQLSRLDRRLTMALPLWIGTLADIDDLLPAKAGLFDLVILDEASSIDQPLAAPALLRGERAVVVGDPRQLRHVSFLPDDRLRATLAEHGLDDDPLLAARLDVRRNSAFDVAAAVTPVVTLDEQFRSAPHLVQFVASRLYGGAVTVASATPANEDTDCIEVVRVAGTRTRSGVVQAEVDEVVSQLELLLEQGARSVGVVTPFRSQADALERAVLEAFSHEQLEALDLRVGTVHGFQGNERDTVIVSLGVGEAGGGRAWAFVEDAPLFTVMVTRARQRLVLVMAGEPPAGGLVAEYLAQADRPPGPPRPAATPSPWVASIAGDLDGAGIRAIPSYPTGRHQVDLVVGEGDGAIGLECHVHPSGPVAHIERHLALQRAGWHLADAFPSRWSERRPELVVDLIGRVAPTRPVSADD